MQHQQFKDEIASLQCGVKTISKDSPLYRLDPVMDGEILRVGGRLSKASLPVESKRPAILSKDLHVSTLILRHSSAARSFWKKLHVVQFNAEILDYKSKLCCQECNFRLCCLQTQ